MSNPQKHKAKKSVSTVVPELMLTWTDTKLSGQQVLTKLKGINDMLQCNAQFVDGLADGKNEYIVKFEESKDLTNFQSLAQKSGTILESMLAGFKVQEAFAGTNHNHISSSVSQNDDSGETSEEEDIDVGEECKDNNGLIDSTSNEQEWQWKVGDRVEVDDGDGFRICNIINIKGDILDVKYLTDETNGIDLTDDDTKIRKYSGQSVLAKNKKEKKIKTGNQERSNNSSHVGSSDFSSFPNLNKNTKVSATMNKECHLQQDEEIQANLPSEASEANDENDPNAKNDEHDNNGASSENTDNKDDEMDDYKIFDMENEKQETNKEHSNNNNNDNNNNNNNNNRNGYNSYAPCDYATDQGNSNIVCKICKKPLTTQEYKSQNASYHSRCINVNENSIVTNNNNKMQNQYQDTQNIQNGQNGQNLRKPLWYEAFVGNTSQFKQESTGSCTINGLEAAIQLQLEKKPSIQLVDKIVEIASVYKADKHTGMEDVFPSISRYGESLEQVDYLQLLKSAGHVLFKTMQNWVDKHNHAISCVVTAPPESFFLHLDLIGTVTMFDSHPRGHLGLKNSHFLLFENSEKCLEYLKQELFRCVKLDVSDISAYQLQAMNAFEANLLMLKFDAIVDDTPDIEKLKRELMRVDDRLNKEYEFESRKHGNDYSDLKNNKNTSSRDRAGEANGNVHDKKEMEIQLLRNQNEALKYQIEVLKKKLQQEQQKNRRKIENNNEEKQQNILDDFKKGDQNQFFCRECSKYLSSDMKVIFSSCHCENICRNCARLYLEKEINQKKVEIKCPLCQKENITENDMELLDTNATLVLQYRDIIVRKFGLNNQNNENNNYNDNNNIDLRKNFHHSGLDVELPCQTTDCHFHGKISKWKQLSFIICPHCNDVYCKECFLNWGYHKGFVDCKTARHRCNDKKRFLLCPNCKTWHENKTAGSTQYLIFQNCNNCNLNLCFACGESSKSRFTKKGHTMVFCDGNRFKKQ